MFDGDEYEDQILGGPNELGNLFEGRELNPLEDERPEEVDDDQNQENVGDGEGETSKPKKKRVLNPQPKLDAIRLTGPRGISAIEGLFRDFKFNGSGHEEQDLKRVLEKLELWGNRLFPKYQFDDLLDKVEKLGQKRPVMNFVNRIRIGLEEELVPDNTEEDAIDNEGMDGPQPCQGNRGVSSDDTFTQLIEEQISLISSSQRQDKTPAKTEVIITDEQRERMLQNRRLAEERRLARLQDQQVRSSEVRAVDLIPKTQSPTVPNDSKFEEDVSVIENKESSVINECAGENMNEVQTVMHDHEESVEIENKTGPTNCDNDLDPNSLLTENTSIK